MIHSLITLGTPHHSLEQYPLGRIPEKLKHLHEDDVKKNEKIKSSSLQFANFYYPRGDAFVRDNVRMYCIVGDAVAGSVEVEVVNNNSKTITSKKTKNWLVYESYKSGCGRGEVSGDGVTPVCIAHLEGAEENVVMPGVYHGPFSTESDEDERVWYGSAAVVERWWQYCLPDHYAP